MNTKLLSIALSKCRPYSKTEWYLYCTPAEFRELFKQGMYCSEWIMPHVNYMLDNGKSHTEIYCFVPRKQLRETLEKLHNTRNEK